MRRHLTRFTAALRRRSALRRMFNAATHPTSIRGVAMLFGGCALIGLSLGAAQDAAAQTPFYTGKQIRLMVGGTAGSGLDLAARAVAQHLAKYLPGNPSIVTQDLGGAGGVRLIEYLHGSAPRDGTVIGLLPAGPLIEPLVGNRNPPYKISDFTSIGALSKDLSLCVAWHETPFKTIEDVKKAEMTVGGTGVGSNPDVLPVVLNKMIGTKFKLISGYVGSQEITLAIERKEVEGRCGWSLASIQSGQPTWLPQKQLNVLLQFAQKRSALFPNVPTVYELIQKPEDKKLMDLLLAPLQLGRPFMAPPGLQAERVAELRKAFAQVVTDKEFLVDAAKAGLTDLDPTLGEEMHKALADVYASPPAVVQQARTLLAK